MDSTTAGTRFGSGTMAWKVCTASALPSPTVTVTVALPGETGVRVIVEPELLTLTIPGSPDRADQVSESPSGR